MKKNSSIGIFIMLVLLLSGQLNSQTKSTAAQTVQFAVNHSSRTIQNTLFSGSQRDGSFQFSGAAVLNVLDKASMKVTIAQTPTPRMEVKIPAPVHMDIRSILQSNHSFGVEKTSETVITVTE